MTTAPNAEPPKTPAGAVVPAPASSRNPPREQEHALLQAERAAALWKILKDPEPWLCHLNGREVEKYLTRALFGDNVTVEQRALHRKTLAAIEDIGRNFDPLRYYATVMHSWPLNRFTEVSLGPAPSRRPVISYTPLTIELGYSAADWSWRRSAGGQISTKATIIRGQRFQPELSSRVVHYLNEHVEATPKQQKEWRIHERAHSMGYRFAGVPEVFTPEDLRAELAELLPDFDLARVKSLMQRAQDSYESSAWGEVLAHYLAGGRPGSLTRYLDQEPQKHLHELYEYLWLVDIPRSERQAVYASAAATFRAVTRAAQEYHFLADLLFHPRDGTERHPAAEGLLLTTGIDERRKLAPLAGVDEHAIRDTMTRESLRVLSKQGVVDKSGASPESEIPRDAFVVSSVALARLFPGGKIELGELKALVPDFTHLLSTSPDPLLARTTRSLMKMGEAVTRIGNSLVDPATVEAAALLRDSVHSHAEQHYPSFNGEPPLRKVAVDLGKKRTPEAIAQLFEILPEGDSRSWGRHVVTEDVYRTIKEHNAWGLFCALVERGGNAPGIRYAFEVSYEMDFAKLSAAELKRLRQALKALPKRIPEIHLGEAIGDRLILRLREWGLSIRNGIRAVRGLVEKGFPGGDARGAS